MTSEEPSLTNKPGKKGLARIFAATNYSLKGLKSAWKDEAAFRQESVAFLVCLPIAFWLANSAFETALLLFSGSIVLIIELLNSAVEAVVDRVSAEQHPLSGKAKDIGSAAVMLSILQFFAVWGIIGWTNLFC